jgi:hypothetical protein
MPRNLFTINAVAIISYTKRLWRHVAPHSVCATTYRGAPLALVLNTRVFDFKLRIIAPAAPPYEALVAMPLYTKQFMTSCCESLRKRHPLRSTVNNNLVYEALMTSCCTSMCLHNTLHDSRMRSVCDVILRIIVPVSSLRSTCNSNLECKGLWRHVAHHCTCATPYGSPVGILS